MSRGHERPQLVGHAATAEALASIATDIAPAAGNDAPDCLLGPYADLPDRTTGQRRARLMALAEACFLVPQGERYPPVHPWLRRSPKPPVAQREAVRAVWRAPLAPWRLHGGNGWRVEPLLDLPEPWVPRDALSLAGLGDVATGPSDGGLLLARLVPTQTGWSCPVGWVLPSAPGKATWERWALTEDQGYATREELLRERGHALVRRAHGLAWLEARRKGELWPS